MKRPFKPTVNYRASFGIVRLDFTKEQFAGIGHVAMAFNEVEASIYHLFGIATDIADRMLAEVFTRINGVDGAIAIILHGAERAGLSSEEMDALRDTLGDGTFGKYKKLRDGVIHARSFNAPAGIGVRIERRARVQEVLMTASALETLASHLAVLAHEISWFDDIVLDRRNLPADAADQEKAQYEEYFRECFSRFQESRSQRLSLPPLPEFPSESELLEAQDQWQEQLPFVKVTKPSKQEG